MLIDRRYVYRDGVYIPSSEWGYIIDRRRPGEVEMIDKLKSVKLKEVEFRQATVTQVVATVNEMQKIQFGRVVVPIAVDLQGYRQFVGSRHPGNSEDSTAEDWRLFDLRTREVPPFTFSCQEINLFELLRMISLATYLPMNIDAKSVTLSQKPFQEAASNNTSDGIRQPAAGSPKPIM